MEEWVNATNEQLADEAGEAMVEIATLYRQVVKERRWVQAERVAQTIALMGAQCADAAEAMQAIERGK
jgi:hypothetical protein